MTADLRSVLTALRAGSPVVVDVPVEIRRFLFARYFEMSIRNARLGLVSIGMLLFGIAYEAPLGPRLAVLAGVGSLLVARGWLAGQLSKRLDEADPRSNLAHDLLLVIGSSSWSVAPFVLQDVVSPPHLFGVVYGAFVAVAVMSVSYHSALPAGMVLVAASVIPLTLFMALQGTLLFGVLAFATLVCVASLLARVRSSHGTLLDSLASERENGLLVAELQGLRRRLEVENASLGDSLRDASHAASRDPLTGVHNRRHLASYAHPLAALVEGGRETVAVCMADVDHFKRVNDVYGHPAGDEVLQAVAGLLGTRLRDGDCLARFGGEEFVIVLRRCDAGRARRVAEALRHNVASAEIDTEVGPVEVTASFGVAQWVPGEDFDAVVQRADRALYRAKRDGRDRVVVDGDEMARPAGARAELTLPGALH